MSKRFHQDKKFVRLRAAFEENGGPREANPFGERAVRLYLSEVRDLQASPCSSSAFLSATQSSPSLSPSPPPPDTLSAACVGTSSIHSPLSTFSPSPLVKSCDVYLGFARHLPLLRRFVNWLRAELEEQGVRCFASDRRTCRDAYGHGAAKAAMDAAAVGVVVITDASFSNPYSMEEMRWFLERKKLLPVFFGLLQGDCVARDIIERKGEVWERHGGRLWTLYGGIEGEWKAVVNGVLRSSLKLEVHAGNFRDKILDAIFLLGTALGRRSMVDKVKRWREMAKKELPFPRNANFVGRKSELANLEMMLFGDIDRNNRRGNEKRSKDKEPVLWKESDEETEMQGHSSDWLVGQSRNRSAPSLSFRKGVACVCGDTGIGKTELLLEFAYKFFQRYKMILWVGGESKYLRQNYLSLLTLLGVEITMEFDYYSETNGPRSFEEMETNAIGRVRREVMRGIPFLLIIDNLESEKDWWGGRNIMQLLPRFGGETHIIISSCLPQILNIRPLKLSYLSAAEAMLLMKGKKTDLTTEDHVALRIIEEKLGRMPLGLAIVGAILSELQMDPRKLLDTMNQMPYRELKLNEKENLVLKHNRGFIQLLDTCFSILDNMQKPSMLATKMAEASYWFAPSPIPISMLFNSSSMLLTKHHNTKFWNRCFSLFPCKCEESDVSSTGAEASSYLIRYSIARSCTLSGYISFHNIIRIYGHERNKDVSVSVIIKAIQNEGDLQNHANHMWAACFLVFKIDLHPGGVDLSPTDVLSFIRSLALPLASRSFANYSHCSASLDLLRVATEALEGLEDSFLSEATAGQCKTKCFKSSNSQSLIESYPLLYHDLACLRALLLETRAKFMLQGGQYDIGEQLCRTAVSIKEVIFGNEHPQTQATRAILETLLWFQSKI